MIIALLGAESTGKTALAHALALQLQLQGKDAVAVDEYLREWCAAHGRTPHQHEQAGIAAEQQQRIAAAAAQHSVVVADTTALMTAVYSDYVFADRSLYAQAAAQHALCDMTLVTGLDVPWQPDGIQRDGEHARAPVDRLLRDALNQAKNCLQHRVWAGAAAAGWRYELHSCASSKYLDYRPKRHQKMDRHVR
jgi:nicotinamide riboside kinase